MEVGNFQHRYKWIVVTTRIPLGGIRQDLISRSRYRYLQHYVARIGRGCEEPRVSQLITCQAGRHCRGHDWRYTTSVIVGHHPTPYAGRMRHALGWWARRTLIAFVAVGIAIPIGEYLSRTR